ncbi:MAG: peptidoglycan DD-metalloendopeptidase family protein [Anaerolineales bacterium]|nr:peptidoglycan DD-metalloendopeptidase family protein [Anaerolineales bacterium]
MLRILRKINVVLLILAALLGVTLWRTQSATAVTVTPFLYEPYYGNWNPISKKYDNYSTITRTASFDHNLPDYNQTEPNSTFTFRNGNVVTVVPGTLCGSGGGERNCYNGHPGIDYNLTYAPVVAAYSGTIKYAGWESTNHDGLNLGLTVRMEHKVGSTTPNYLTVYGHLSGITVATGQVIAKYDPNWKAHEQIGTSGTSGNSPRPHLHFEVRTWYNNAWKVVDPFPWTGPSGEDTWKNRSGVESVNLWVAAPRQYPPPGDGPVVIDDNNTNTGGFSASSGWTTAPGGYNNGGFRWRYTTSSVTANGWARWRPTVPISTRYEPQVYIPAWTSTTEGNRTHAARYEIWSNGSHIRTVIVDQHRVGYFTDRDTGAITYSGQWISLGRYFFPSGTNSYVRVTDSTFGICNQVDDTNNNCSSYYSETTGTKRILVDAMQAYAN